MPRFTSLLLLAITGLVTSGSLANAQEKQQKAAAVANMKRAELGNPVVVETENFLIATTLSEDKAKALGAMLEKVGPVARKALHFEEKEEPWKGKLAVYYLPESRDFKSFMRSVVVAQPEGPHWELRSDNPFVVDPVDVPAKATEADHFANTAAIVAGAYLRGKGGTVTVPNWLADGFGRAMAMRAEGLNSKRYTASRAAARSMAAKGWKASDLWAETKPMGADVLATSFAEFLALGPMGKEFPKIISAFRPDENGNTPSVQQALEAGGWKDMAAMDAAWKKWATAVK